MFFADGKALVVIGPDGVQGYDAAALLARRELDLIQAIPAARLMAAGLGAMAAAGIVHRDFRTSAVMMGGGQVRIVPLACPPDVRVE